MSLNLHCKEFNLWQTPTDVTMRALGDGNEHWTVTMGVYIEWVIQKAINSDGSIDKDMQSMIDAHLRLLNDAVKKHRKLTFGCI